MGKELRNKCLNSATAQTQLKAFIDLFEIGGSYIGIVTTLNILLFYWFLTQINSLVQKCNYRLKYNTHLRARLDRKSSKSCTVYKSVTCCKKDATTGQCQMNA